MQTLRTILLNQSVGLESSREKLIAQYRQPGEKNNCCHIYFSNLLQQNSVCECRRHVICTEFRCACYKQFVKNGIIISSHWQLLFVKYCALSTLKLILPIGTVSLASLPSQTCITKIDIAVTVHVSIIPLPTSGYKCVPVC